MKNIRTNREGIRAAIAVLAISVVSSSAEAQWSVTNLAPAGATRSQAFGVRGGQQTGSAIIGGAVRAGIWSGTAASWQSLHPAGADKSQAYSQFAGRQVGYAEVRGWKHASLWNGTAASWVDLHPGGALLSSANAVNAGQQVGYVVGGDAVQRASLWSGSVASRVNLHPVGATASSANGIAGGQQSGFAEVAGTRQASLWTGTSASWVSLHPAGATASYARKTDGDQQAGWAIVGGVEHASLWTGTAASWVDLNPAGASGSRAFGVYGGEQTGSAVIGGVTRATMWSGTAASAVDLHSFLSATFTSSVGQEIWSDGSFTYVSGSGFNGLTGQEEALMWVTSDQEQEVVLPDSYSLFRGILLVGELSDLFASDDRWMYVRPGITLNQAERQVQLIVTGTAPTETPTELRFLAEAHASINNIGQWIELWNYDTNSWEQVDYMIATTADSIVEVSITTDPGRFVQTGTKQMRAKVSYKEAGIVLHYPWLIFFDRTVWTIIHSP